jgi:HSP20 family protein
MDLVQWRPFTELDSVERRMRRVFEEIGLAPTLVPAADVYETEDEYVFELEVPGYEEKDLTVEVSDHTLSVKGAREVAGEEKTKEFSLHERLERTFERRFAFPGEADVEHLKAVYSKGVLSVSAPKRTAATPTKVVITSA